MKKLINLLSNFMEADEGNVIDAFRSLPGAISMPVLEDEYDAIYVPPTRKNSVLLVAHSDTVFGDGVEVAFDGVQFFSPPDSQDGIGADNRAGCAMLWALRKTGHGLLLVPGEEMGCIGSSYVAKHHLQHIVPPQFLLQFDRRGCEDLVYYDCRNQDIRKFLDLHYAAYSEASGSFTDICQLCPALEKSGANVSVGFYNEHTSNELLDIFDWLRTYTTTRNLLAQEGLPEFQYIPARGYDWSQHWHEDPYDPQDVWSYADYWCPDCAYALDDQEVVEQGGDLLCYYCGRTAELMSAV